MLGTTEIIIVAIIVMFLFGAGKLPEIARSVGKSTKEAKDYLDTAKDIKSEALKEVRDLKAGALKEVSGLRTGATKEINSFKQDIS
jgi:sec-independent protein translocase protein TatA